MAIGPNGMGRTIDLCEVLAMVALGVFLHAVGGFAAGSFYIPFKKVRKWAWESYWLVGRLTFALSMRYLGMSLGYAVAR